MSVVLNDLLLFSCLAALVTGIVIAAVVMMGPAFAEQSSNAKVVSAELRAKCQAQVRTLRIRGGGTSAKKRRSAAVQQCIANGGGL
jgi:hypothetical protein